MEQRIRDYVRAHEAEEIARLDALDGLGVIGMRSHTPDERVDLRSIAPATEGAAILIYRLTHQQ